MPNSVPSVQVVQHLLEMLKPQGRFAPALLDRAGWLINFCRTTMVQMHDGVFKWNAAMQGVVLSSFYYGYITTTLVGGVLALKLGGKILLMIAVGWTAALSIATPPLTIVGDAYAIITVRALEGVGQVSAIQRRTAEIYSRDFFNPFCSFLSSPFSHFVSFSPLYFAPRSGPSNPAKAFGERN